MLFGRFARGFDLANKGKDALYFDLDDGFPQCGFDGKVPCYGREVTYYDFGTGSWQLYYDAIKQQQTCCKFLSAAILKPGRR